VNTLATARLSGFRHLMNFAVRATTTIGALSTVRTGVRQTVPQAAEQVAASHAATAGTGASVPASATVQQKHNAKTARIATTTPFIIVSYVKVCLKMVCVKIVL